MSCAVERVTDSSGPSRKHRHPVRSSWHGKGVRLVREVSRDVRVIRVISLTSWQGGMGRNLHGPSIRALVGVLGRHEAAGKDQEQVHGDCRKLI